MRVQVQIPGTVESYCVNERGDKLEASEEHWLETYLCSVLRAYSYADNGSGDVIKKIVGVRRFNPIINTESEHKFLDAAERLFFNGSSILTSQCLLMLTSLRLAAWVRSRDPGPELCVKPSHYRSDVIHSNYRKICIRNQSLRKIEDARSGSVFAAR